MQRLFDICVQGLDIVERLPAIYKIEPSDFRFPADGADEFRMVDNAEFSKTEREQGFPLLHAYTLVSVWGALEAAIEDMLVGVLLNEPAVLANDELAKTKIDLATFELLNKEERMRFLLSEIQRKPASGLAQGINSFENVLKVFGLSGPVDDDIKKELWELNHLRNLIVHRASRADLRFVQACPAMNLSVGDLVIVRHERYRDYIQAVAGYVQTIVRRLSARYDPAGQGDGC
jgi:hypothetical protein